MYRYFCFINPLFCCGRQSLEARLNKMVNMFIKSKACKEFTKKNGPGLKKSKSSTKSLKSNIDLKVSVAKGSEVAVDVSVKYKNNQKNKKGSLWSDESFLCPNPECGIVVHRYRNLFNHFSDKCQPLGFQHFRWWCSGCSIPRFWVGAADLIKHKQEFHDMGLADWPVDGSYPSKYLSFKAVPEGFNPMELLEHNRHFFGTFASSKAWSEEVRRSKDSVGDTHKMIYKRPDSGTESKRKLDACRVKYGTVRASRSVSAITKVAAGEWASEVMERIIDMAWFSISVSEEVNKKLFEFDIDGEYVLVEPRAVHLLDMRDVAHREKVAAQDAEIKRLNEYISVREKFHKKEMKRVTSSCEEGLKEVGDMAHSQGVVYGQTLMAERDLLIEQFKLATNNALRVATEQRWENISSLKELTKETGARLVTNQSVVEID